MYGEAEDGLRWSVNCNGDESNLGECTAHAEYGSSAGVICQGASAPQTNKYYTFITSLFDLQ